MAPDQASTIHICEHFSLISSGSFTFLPRNPTAYFNGVLEDIKSVTPKETKEVET
jgi:hypothetical protein